MRRHHLSGFSLIEAVLALGVGALVLMPMLGLFGVGLSSVHDSDVRLEAADVASTILDKRLVAPALSNFSPLPPIDANDLSSLPSQPPSSGTAIPYIDSGGDNVSSAPQTAKYSLNYRVWLDNQTFAGSAIKLVRIDLVLTWPPNAPVTPHNQYELLTSRLVGP